MSKVKIAQNISSQSEQNLSKSQFPRISSFRWTLQSQLALIAMIAIPTGLVTQRIKAHSDYNNLQAALDEDFPGITALDETGGFENQPLNNFKDLLSATFTTPRKYDTFEATSCSLQDHDIDLIPNSCLLYTSDAADE